MKKIKTLRGFIIALDKEGNHIVFTKDEWAMGEGFRYAEWEAGQDIQEAIDFIKSY